MRRPSSCKNSPFPRSHNSSSILQRVIYSFYVSTPSVQRRFGSNWVCFLPLSFLELETHTHATFGVSLRKAFAPAMRNLTNLVYPLHDGIVQHEHFHRGETTSPIYPAVV